MDLNLFIVTSAALLDSINPCAISVLLLTIGFLFSLNKVRSEIYKSGFVYIGSIYLTYLFIGLGVLQALTILGFPHVLAKIGAGILFATGLINLLGDMIPHFPIKLKIPNSAHAILAQYIKKATYPSMFVLGILVGLFEFPCTGGPYLTILSILHDKATFASGLAYLLYYNVIFVSPLVVILIIANSKLVLKKVEGWKKEYTKRVDIVSSVLMMVLSVIIFWVS
jgi:cytochrome c biogenesis protein CcdA